MCLPLPLVAVAEVDVVGSGSTSFGGARRILMGGGVVIRSTSGLGEGVSYYIQDTGRESLLVRDCDDDVDTFTLLLGIGILHLLILLILLIVILLIHHGNERFLCKPKFL